MVIVKTAAILVAIVAIYGSFIVAGVLHKKSKLAWAMAAPLLVFLPIALISLGLVKSVTLIDGGVLLGFSLLLSLVIWLHQRGG